MLLLLDMHFILMLQVLERINQTEDYQLCNTV